MKHIPSGIKIVSCLLTRSLRREPPVLCLHQKTGAVDINISIRIKVRPKSNIAVYRIRFQLLRTLKLLNKMRGLHDRGCYEMAMP